MEEWKVEYNDKTNEPYLRLHDRNGRTTVYLERKYLDRDNTSIPQETIDELDRAYEDWLQIPF